MATIQELVDQCTTLMSQVAGLSVQLYAEDRIFLMLQQHANLYYPKLWWPALMQWTPAVALDGVNGEPSTAITGLQKYEDIRALFVTGEKHPLRSAPINQNLYLISGTKPRYIDAAQVTPSKIFRVWPLAATGTVVVNWRKKPADFSTFSDTDLNPYDDELLVWSVVYSYLEDDGTNPGATEKYRNLAEGRFAELERAINTVTVPFRDANRITKDEWTIS